MSFTEQMMEAATVRQMSLRTAALVCDELLGMKRCEVAEAVPGVGAVLPVPGRCRTCRAPSGHVMSGRTSGRALVLMPVEWTLTGCINCAEVTFARSTLRLVGP